MPGLGALVRFLVYLPAILLSFIDDSSIIRSIDNVHALRSEVDSSTIQLSMRTRTRRLLEPARDASSWFVARPFRREPEPRCTPEQCC